MAIIRMGSSTTHDAEYNRVARTEFHEGEYCPMPTPGAMNADRQGDTLYEEYAGCCISEFERNGYDDSDFYMVVWDEAEQQIKTLLYATTRGWCYPCFGSRVDATPEVLAKVEALQEKARIEQEKRAAEIKEKAPNKGDTVLVDGFVRGKNACLNGKVGEVFWIGVDRFKKYAYTIGLKINGEKFFVPADRAFKGDVRCDHGIESLNAFNNVRNMVGC